ncbi:MAG: O-antigen ligase family protein [Bdellovibrionota bacterium]
MTQIAPRPDRFAAAATAVLAFLYAFALFFYGAVTPGGRLAFEFLAIVAASLAVLESLRRGELHLPNRRSLLAALLFWGWMVFLARHSIYEEASERSALFVFHYGLLYFALVAGLREKAHVERALSFLLLLAVFLSVWGLAGRVGAGEPASGAYKAWGLTGSFVNHNHFATLLGMLLPAGLYSVLGLKSRATRPGSLFDNPWFYLALSLLVLLFLALTLSLGAFVALAVVLLAMLIDRATSPASDRVQSLATGAALLGLAGFILAAWFGFEPLARRLARVSVGEEASALERLLFWKAAVQTGLEEPFTGTGPATFAHAFANVRPPGMPYLVEFAHNEWLQLLAETGVTGLALFLIVIAAYASYAFHPAHPIRDNYYRRLARGAALGLLFLAVHSFFDFPLHIPGNAAIAVALAAILTAAACRRESAWAAATLRLPASSLRRLPWAVGAALLFLGLIYMDARVFLADAAAAEAASELAAGDLPHAEEQARDAIGYRPKDAAHLHLLARILTARAARTEEGADKKALLEEALSVLERAVQAAPRWPRYRTDLAALSARLGRNDDAEANFLRAVELAPNDPYPLFERGKHYWRTQRLGLGALDLRRAQEIDITFVGPTFELLRRSVGDDPGRLRQLAPFLEAAVPDRAGALSLLSALYRKAGLRAEHRRILERGLAANPDDVSLLEDAVSALWDAGDAEGARELAAHFSVRHPQDAKGFWILGRTHVRTDRWADAIEAYSASLAITPDQPAVWRALEDARKILGRQEGEALWRDLIERFPTNGAYHRELSREFVREGKWMDAIQEMKLAVQKSPGELSYRSELAELYLRKDLRHQAIEQWEEISERSPRDAAPLLKIAKLYLQMELPDRARPYYEKILRINPNHAEARKFLTETAR